jgi:hypothetical protein
MADELWKQEAIKMGGQNLVGKIIEMSDGIHALVKSADANDDRMRDTEMAIQKLYSAFPSGDVDGHRRYHEAVIQSVIARNKLYTHLLEKGLGGILWAAIVGLSMMLWFGFLHIIGQK